MSDPLQIGAMVVLVIFVVWGIGMIIMVANDRRNDAAWEEWFNGYKKRNDYE